MFERPALLGVAVAALVAAFVWGRSAARLRRARNRIAKAVGQDGGATELTQAAFLKDVHSVLLYAVVAAVAIAESLTRDDRIDLVVVVLVVPVLVSIRYADVILGHARIAESRSHLEQRAQEVLVQEALAPRRWAARLAPEEPPEIPGFEVGVLYRAGTGMMAGDFYDLVQTAPNRFVAVVGDVSGHGIDSSITAFQAKHLLRVFLRQYRDPGQALEELNAQITSRPEEFISMAVVMCDTEVGTIRYASAGHPPGFFWHGGDVHALPATGPLLSLVPDASIGSRELPLEPGDLLLLYTDGLAEARNGDQLFGEERIAERLRREVNAEPDVLCKSLMEAAEDFATEPLGDDTAILVVRRL